MRANPSQASLALPRPSHSLWSRLYGLGSIFGKSVRDSRRAFVVEVILLGGLMFLILGGIGAAYPTQEARNEIARLATEMGSAAQGIAGKPVNVGTPGGYVQWKYGPVFLWIAVLWSILALSRSLASEARRGSLDILAASPISRRRIALEKVGAHLSVLGIVMVVMTLAAWLGGAAFAKLPGDEIPIQAAVGYALWVGLMASAFGGLAFTLAQFFGRAAAAGISGGVLFAGWILNGYQASVPAFRGIANLTPWAWTANHLPLADQYDWVSLVPVAVIAIVLFPIGIEAFARRDLGATTSLRIPRLPVITLGLRGPIGRSFGERLPRALSWGLGLGAFGLVMAAASGSLADEFIKSPDLAKTFHTAFPGIDITSAGGFLQLMVQLLFIVVGFAVVSLINGWVSDETSGRLEMILATPLARRRWAVRSGLGVFAAIAAMTAVFMLAVGIGAASSGSAVGTPVLGSLVLGLYAAALAGVGFAIAGMFRSSIAGEIVGAIVVVTYLLDLVAPVFKLPDWVHQLALSAHLGQPMIGTWNAAGMVACLVIAAGGLAIGAWGLARRDLRSS